MSGEDVTEPRSEGMLASSQGFGSSSGLPGGQAPGHEEGSEVARFGAAKEKKHSLENGITVFNRWELLASQLPILLSQTRATWVHGLARCIQMIHSTVFRLVSLEQACSTSTHFENRQVLLHHCLP